MINVLKIAPAATTLVTAVAGSLYASCVYSSQKQIDERFTRLIITAFASMAIGLLTQSFVERQGVKKSDDGSGTRDVIGFMSMVGTFGTMILADFGKEFAKNR
ncbi:MAG: hypothetical protein ABSA17_01250 [Rhabdochlamydiaceae bacterium]